MSRVFWLAVGAGGGVYAMLKTRRLAERFTPTGIRDQVGAARFGLGVFGEEVHQGMAERETALRDQLGLLDPGQQTPALSARVERARPEGDSH